mmetsp:Transcript_27891/g.73026  ORF Transcript_27891/g.73026 Transcript_27891/m.73026 type:complete len:403 (-) Transcript_27891:273-1481(-)
MRHVVLEQPRFTVLPEAWRIGEEMVAHDHCIAVLEAHLPHRVGGARGLAHAVEPLERVHPVPHHLLGHPHYLWVQQPPGSLEDVVLDPGLDFARPQPSALDPRGVQLDRLLTLDRAAGPQHVDRGADAEQLPLPHHRQGLLPLGLVLAWLQGGALEELLRLLRRDADVDRCWMMRRVHADQVFRNDGFVPLVDPLHEVLQVVLRRGGHVEDAGVAATLAQPGHELGEVVEPLCDVALVHDHNLWLGVLLGAVLAKVLLDEVEIAEGILRVEGHHVHQRATALDVAQERVAQPPALPRAVYEARHVDKREDAVSVMAVGAQVGANRGEGVGGNLCLLARQGAQQGRLPGVRNPDDAHVGDVLQHALDPAEDTLLARLQDPRRVILGGLEGRVPAASCATSGHQ